MMTFLKAPEMVTTDKAREIYCVDRMSKTHEGSTGTCAYARRLPRSTEIYHIMGRNPIPRGEGKSSAIPE